MNIQLKIKSNGIVEASDAGTIARPISAYAEGQRESNFVYVVVNKKYAQDKGESLEMKIFDMNARTTVRALSLVVLVADKELNPTKTNSADIVIETSLGTLKENPKAFSPAFTPAARVLLRMIWTKGVPKLLNVILKAQELYCEKYKKIEHKPWLSSLEGKDDSKILDYYKKQIEMQLARNDS